jgi:hypothetical protein
MIANKLFLKNKMEREENILLSRPTPNYDSLNSEIDISPETPLLPSPPSADTNIPSRWLCGFTRPTLNIIPLKLQLYLYDVLLRFFQFVIILIFLFTFLTVFKYKAIPDSNDYSDIKFDWKWDPGSYLNPVNSSFSNFNVLLDGHSHTSFSDGQMNPDQLLQWAIGKKKLFIKYIPL